METHLRGALDVLGPHEVQNAGDLSCGKDVIKVVLIYSGLRALHLKGLRLRLGDHNSVNGHIGGEVLVDTRLWEVEIEHELHC